MGRRSSHLASLASLGALLSSAAPHAAVADITKADCIEADTRAQNERRGLQFRRAREDLEACSQEACPKLVRDDCTQRLNDLDTATPSVTFAAKDAAGEDLVAVKVAMDGAPIAHTLSGAALRVDPGPHAFTFETSGAATVTKRLVLREGERGRTETVTFADLHSDASPREKRAEGAATPDAGAKRWGGQRTGAVVLGGAGVAGVVVGAVLGAMSFSAWSSSKAACSTGPGGCPDRAKALADHDSAVTDALVSDVGFVAGGLLLAGAVALFVTAPSGDGARSPSSTAVSLGVTPALLPGGGALRFGGSF